MGLIADALASFGTVARHGFRLARDRHGRRELPGTLEALQPPWLTRALGRAVRSVEIVGGDEGTSSRGRLRLGYGPGEDGPGTLFAKLPARDLTTALFGSVLALGAHEVRFYVELAGTLSVDVPRGYVARREGSRFVLLLEDLAGCRFRALDQPCGAEDARAVVSELARLHAHHWESPRLDADLAWLPRRGAEPAYRVARLLCRLATRPALRRYGASVPEHLRRAAPRIHALRERLEDAWATPPRTLLHGDPHLGNLYFRPSGRPGFLDWQVLRCGQGLRDVTHFLVSSLSVEDRRAWEAGLLEHYVESLARYGVRDFPLARARSQFRLQTFYTWFGATVTAAAGTLQSQAVSAVAMERAATAIQDWDALAALEAL